MRRWGWVWSGLPLLLVGVLMAHHVLTQMTANNVQPVATLPKLAQIGSFSLVDQYGQPVTDLELRGNIWLAQFFFTSCPGICPAISHQMAQIQQMTTQIPKFLLVSISIDPQDTPPVLKEYAARMGAEAGRWLFLTGTPQQVEKLVRQDFMIGFQPTAAADQATQGRFVHSTKLALVDQDGVVRGYYDGMDIDAPQRIVSDLSLLLQNP